MPRFTVFSLVIGITLLVTNRHWDITTRHKDITTCHRYISTRHRDTTKEHRDISLKHRNNTMERIYKPMEYDDFLLIRMVIMNWFFYNSPGRGKIQLEINLPNWQCLLHKGWPGLYPVISLLALRNLSSKKHIPLKNLTILLSQWQTFSIMLITVQREKYFCEIAANLCIQLYGMLKYPVR